MDRESVAGWYAAGTASGGPRMIRYQEALQQLLAHVTPVGEENCPLAQASGRVLAGALQSPMALPSFDHAAMDGYALFSGDGLEAGSEHVVHGSQAAGDVTGHSAEGAWEIMTGACLPKGLDAVIAVERTELLETRPDGSPLRIRLRDPLAKGRNVRLAGADIATGVEMMAAGSRIGAAQTMLLAALGVASIPVARRPRVAVICTGKELQADPAQPLTPGRIYNSNGPYLVAELTAAGAQVCSCETVDDSAVTYKEALQRVTKAGVDLVISTGAVSMGRYDFVPDVLRGLNAEILFHKIAIRPGRPVLGARLAQGPLLLALPGTPMAVAVGLRFLVAPVLRAMIGQAPERPLRAVLGTSISSRPGLRQFLRVSLAQDDEGRLLAAASPWQQPFRIHPFAQEDGWLVVPEDVDTDSAGMVFDVFSLGAGLAGALSVGTAGSDDGRGERA